MSVSAQWKRFWNLVQESARDRSLAGVQSKIMTPVTQARFEVLSKQHHLMELRELSASGLGVLMDSALDFDDDAGSMMTRSNDEWKTIVSKSITLMESVLRHATASDTGVSQFETLIFSKVEEATPVADEGDVQRPAHLATKLHLLHAIYMPQFSENMRNLKKEYGRPSRLTRYWIPGLALALSSSTLLKVLFSRKAKIITWIHDFGATSRDFWFNWVVEPIRKTIGTIRHDKESEIAIMSKDSLIGDRESLERMVVDFAVDNSGGNLSEAAIADIRAKTKTGDLTPVLLAYEKDLRRPFVGTIKGDLIRALLIQIQKTKVDVEVAIGGIDSLLKSQELVFAFVGLTPSILICLAVSRWLGGVVTGRSGRKRGKTQTRMVRVLR